MKKYGRILLGATILAGASAYAAPIAAIGDNAELFFTATAAVRHDDNIYLRNSGEVSDTIFAFTPGLELAFGKNAATSGKVYYNEEILRYNDNTNQNTSLSHVGAAALYNNGKSKLDLGASYNELAQNDISAPGAIVERHLTNVHALGEFGATEKTSIGAGISYDKTDYKINSYSDSDIWSVPLDAYFEYSPKLAVSVGYRYRNSDLSGAAADSKDHFLNVGARGEFTPKVTGQIRVGYQMRDFGSGGNDESSFALDSSFTYAFSEKTNYIIGLSSDFGYSAIGQSTKNRTISVMANNKLDEQWSWSAGLAYRMISYPTRDDDFLEGNLGVSYVYNTHLNFAAGYTYRNQTSDQAPAEFTNNVFSLAANIRY